jgi:hypothetical protein
MKYDTNEFNNLEIGKLFNFNTNMNKIDPFLMEASIDKSSAIAAVGKIRAS